MQAQVETRHEVQFQAMTFVHKVSGGEIAVQVTESGVTRFWFNGHRVTKADVRRKLGH